MNISKALMPHEETEMLLHAFRKAYPDDRQTSALPGGSYVLKRMAELRSELRPPATAGSSANATKLTLDSDESKRVKARMESHPDFSNLVPDRIVRNTIQINGLRVKFGVEELWLSESSRLPGHVSC